MYRLRIVLANNNQYTGTYIKNKLINAGYMIVGEASNARSAQRLAYETQPDLVILDDQLSDKDVVNVARNIEEHRISPVLIITDFERNDEMRELLSDWVIGYICRPVDESALIPTIQVVVSMFQRICRLEDENLKLKRTLERRKTLEKAKGLLIELKGMSERQAYKHLQKVSMDKCIPIHNVAIQIIHSFEQAK